MTEQTPRKPATSPYGNTKQMCEDIRRDSLAAYDGRKGIALRYFNPVSYTHLDVYKRQVQRPADRFQQITDLTHAINYEEDQKIRNNPVCGALRVCGVVLRGG